MSLLNETYISVNCENFMIINNELIELNFSSTNYTFMTKQCIFNISNNTNYTDSFSCQIENISNIINGEYTVQTPTNNKYHLNKNEKIIINNGTLKYIYSSNIPVIDTVIVPNTNNEIIIINSVNSLINKGDSILFRINPINRYYYNNIDQIILMDNKNNNALYLKKCQGNSVGDNITAITCVVSDNILKGNYTSLASGQDIKLGQSQTINLTSESNIGGFISQDIQQVINANISRRDKINFKIKLNVLYYNQTLIPNSIFPYEINISGIKKEQNILNSNLINYDSQFQFQNCTMGNYSKNDSQAIEGISCNLADFIESSSSSKTWIVWVVLACLVAVLGGVFLTIFCINRKKNKEEDNNDSNVNESGENKINNSNEINLGNDNNKKKENNENNDNSVSQSQSQSS